MRGNDSLPPEPPGKHAFFLVAQELCNHSNRQQTQNRTTRREHRITRSISISIQPLDEDFQPVDEPFWVVSRDISPKGLGLICDNPIDFDFVRIGLLNEQVSVIGQVRHSTPIGGNYPLFLIGIEFLHESELA